MVAAKLLDDAHVLSEQFSKAFGAKIAALRQIDGLDVLAEAAE
ncbi:hypothetical protein [Bradyrhizobium genosp. P]